MREWRVTICLGRCRWRMRDQKWLERQKPINVMNIIYIYIIQTLLCWKHSTEWMVGKTTQFVYCTQAKVFNYVILKKTVQQQWRVKLGPFCFYLYNPLYTSPLLGLLLALSVFLSLVTLFMVGSLNKERRFWKST